MKIITNIFKKKSLLYGAFLAIYGFLLYAPDLHNVLFFDDYSFLIYNTFVHNFSWNNVVNWFTQNVVAGAGRITDYYRPLMLFSFAINYAIGKLNPFGYHLVNNIIHIANGIIIYIIISRYVFKKYWMAFLVALIFLIHPAQSEGVAYVSGRGDLLSSVFMLLGLFFWLKELEVKKYLYSIFSILSLILALLSRENAIVFPFLAMVLYISFISKEKFLVSLKNGFLRIIPHLVVVGAYLILRLTVLNFRNFLNFGNYDSQSLYAQSLLVRLFTFMHVFLEYLKNIFFSTNIYEKLTFPISRSFFDWPVWFSGIVIGLLLVLLIFFYKKEKKSGHSDFRIWFFGWGWFFAALLPSIGIIPVNVIMQDHLTYLALVGPFTIAVYYFDLLVGSVKLPWAKFTKIFFISLLVIYLAFFSWVTMQRIIMWSNPEKLLGETIKHEPDALIAYEELGAFYYNNGNYSQAEEAFLAGINKGSKNHELFYVMGDLQIRKKNVEKAIFYYKKAIEIAPSYQLPYQRLVEIYMEHGDTQAIYYLKKMHEFNPDDANVHYNLANILYLIGDREEAFLWVEEGLKITKEDESAQKAFKDLQRIPLSH